MTAQAVILFGNGGHAKVITDILLKNGTDVMGFLVDDAFPEDNAFGMKCLGRFSDCLKYRGCAEFVIAVGDGRIRQRIADAYNLKWHTAVHPAAVIAGGVQIGEGTVVMANAVINPCAKIGKHCILNTGSIVEHDCVIGDFTHLSPNACICGTGRLGRHVWLGAGSTVINNTAVGDNITIGAGGCVVHDLQEPGIYAGVPVRFLRKQ